MIENIESFMNTYTECYPIGGNEAPLLSIFYNINHQGRILCDIIHHDPYFKDGNFSILGLSQGSILAKYIIEYCPLKVPVRNLVTFGGPHMGISFAPKLPKETWLGSSLAYVVNTIIYWNIAQWFIAPADYWRDPQNPEGFLKYSRFLAEANNERNFNQTKKDLWLSLKAARFVKWDFDTTIIP